MTSVAGFLIIVALCGEPQSYFYSAEGMGIPPTYVTEPRRQRSEEASAMIIELMGMENIRKQVDDITPKNRAVCEE